MDLSLTHLGELRFSSLVFQLAKRLLYTKWRDPGEEPKLHLFGQLKGITRQFQGENPIKALLDPYNPTGSTMHVRFNTFKTDLWETSSRSCHLNWVVLDSDWEGEFCRVAESHPKVLAYVKNHNLGLEVPYRYGSETRKYLPDFVVLVGDGHGAADPLHLVV